MNTTQLEPVSEISIIANKINNGLAVFEQRKSELTELDKPAHFSAPDWAWEIREHKQTSKRKNIEKIER